MPDSAPLPSNEDSAPPADADGDGWQLTDDCDDDDATTHPGAPETCNGLDDDCDGSVDDDPIDGSAWYLDSDGDGVGGSSTTVACTAPASFVGSGGDCDDADPAVFPGAVELCSTTWDDDCDGESNEADAADAPTWFPDEDLDGFGDSAAGHRACAPPAAWIATEGDCDDADPSSHPGAIESCGTSADDNCDGVLLSCPIEGDREVTAADWTLLGSPDRGQFGSYVAHRADFDGDGQADLVISALSMGSDWLGEVYGVAGPVAEGGDIADLAAWTLTGTDANPGISVAEVGDLTGDGQNDVVVAPDFRVGTLRVVSGPMASGSHEVTTLDGYDIDGDSVDITQPAISIGDVDGDGVSDLLLGSWTDSDGRGTVYVFLGPVSSDLEVSGADLVVEPSDVGGNFGAEVLAADLDADGREDLIVGAPSWGGTDGAGAIFLYANLNSAVAAPAGEIDGVSSGGGFGRDVTTGDADASGAPDVYVSANNAGSGFDRPGIGYLFYDGVPTGVSSASEADVSVEGVESGAYFGGGGFVGDVNADGRDDLGLSASGEATPAGGDGALYLFYGPLSGDTALATESNAHLYATESAGRALGGSSHAVGCVGDISGDGIDDLAVGASLDSQSAPQAGATFVWRGGY